MEVVSNSRLTLFHLILFAILSQIESNTLKFVSELILQNFPHCIIVDIQAEHENSYEDILPNLVTNVIENSYYKIELKNTSSQLVFNPLATNRFGENCKVVLIKLPNLMSKISLFLEKIENMMTASFAPFGEWDYYIFITTAKRGVVNELLGHHFPSKIKFKLIVSGESKKTSKKKVMVKSICNFCNNGDSQVINFPVDANSGPLKQFNYFPDYTSNLFQKVLRISCPAVPSQIEVKKPWANETNGVNYAKRGDWKYFLEEYLMIKLNFTYHAFLATKGGTGTQLSNGTWIGVTGDLINENADIGTSTAVTPARLHLISFTDSFFEPVFITFVTTHGQQAFTPMALLHPFTFSLWAATLASIPFAFFTFNMIGWIRDYFRMSNGEDMICSRREKWGLMNQIFFVVTSFLEQDSGKSGMPRYSADRCFAAFYLFFVLILTTIYRSKMVELLAYPEIERVPTTFEELSKSNYKIGFLKEGDAAFNVFRSRKDPTYSTIVEKMKIITGEGLPCMEQAIHEKYACIAYNVSLNYLQARNFSNAGSRKLLYAPDATFVLFLGLALQKGSIFKPVFDKVMRWVRPSGLQEVWKNWDMYYSVRLVTRAWWRETGETKLLNEVISQENYSDLTIKHVSGSFYVMAVGFGVSILIFAGEVGLNIMATRLNNIIRKNIRKCCSSILFYFTELTHTIMQQG